VFVDGKLRPPSDYVIVAGSIHFNQVQSRRKIIMLGNVISSRSNVDTLDSYDENKYLFFEDGKLINKKSGYGAYTVVRMVEPNDNIILPSIHLDGTKVLLDNQKVLTLPTSITCFVDNTAVGSARVESSRYYDFTISNEIPANLNAKYILSIGNPDSKIRYDELGKDLLSPLYNFCKVKFSSSNVGKVSIKNNLGFVTLLDYGQEFFVFEKDPIEVYKDSSVTFENFSFYDDVLINPLLNLLSINLNGKEITDYSVSNGILVLGPSVRVKRFGNQISIYYGLPISGDDVVEFEYMSARLIESMTDEILNITSFAIQENPVYSIKEDAILQASNTWSDLKTSSDGVISMSMYHVGDQNIKTDSYIVVKVLYSNGAISYFKNCKIDLLSESLAEDMNSNAYTIKYGKKEIING
ncbi:MAG: hypothetical protein ACRC6E_02560, partial [Fusobacteriaceae bacterium]